VQEADRELAASGYIENGLVVTNEIGGYVEPRTFKDYYDKILKAAGLDNEGITFHALRHTFATRSLERKMDVKTLSAILGHYSVSFTLDTYAHVLDDHKREEMDKLNELYFIPKQPDSFAVIVHNDNGLFTAKSADFVGLTATNEDLNTALNTVKGLIQAHLYTNNVCDVVLPTDVTTADGEFVVVVRM
jgi:hypothetical protein